MITVNGSAVSWGSHSHNGTFSSGETRAIADYTLEQDYNVIIYRWDPDHGGDELMELSNIMLDIRRHAPKAKNKLVMQYIPNARLDKPDGTDFADGFRLLPLNEYTAIYINWLGFDKVVGVEPHSEEFLKHYKNSFAKYPTMDALELIRRKIGYKREYQLVFPDEGSFKRYEKILKEKPRYNSDYVVVQKKRVNGEVVEIKLGEGQRISESKDIIIVDDICTHGTTALKTAQLILERCGQEKNIYLLVAYLEKASAYNSQGIVGKNSPFTKIYVCGPNPFEQIIDPYSKIEYLTYKEECEW